MEEQKFKLTIELVPSTVWFSSIYQIYKRSNQLNKWRKIKKELFEKEGRKCWICGAENTRLEAHEFWEYDDKNHIQKLVAIHHLCSMCHKIKHIGFWFHTEDGRRQLKKEGLSMEDLINHFLKLTIVREKNLKCMRGKHLKYGEKEVNMNGNRILESMTLTGD